MLQQPIVLREIPVFELTGSFSGENQTNTIRFYGVKVSIEDFESFDPGSIPGKTFFIP